MSAELSASERQRLYELEATIARGVQSFIDVGQALSEIRESRLYRDRFVTFDEYCRTVWGFKRSYAYEIMQAARVSEIVSGIPDLPAPANAAVAVELVPLAGEPEELRETWRQAVEQCGSKPTALQVRRLIRADPPAAPSAPASAPAPEGDPEHDTRFEFLEDAVEMLQMLPAPEQCVFPVSAGDVAAVDEAVAWLADWTPRMARAWRAHKHSLRHRPVPA